MYVPLYTNNYMLMTWPNRFCHKLSLATRHLSPLFTELPLTLDPPACSTVPYSLPSREPVVPPLRQTFQTSGLGASWNSSHVLKHHHGSEINKKTRFTCGVMEQTVNS